MLAFLLALIPAGLLLSAVLWSRVQVSWLARAAQVIVLTLPFELVPSLPIASASLRLSQVATVVGFYVLGLLLLRRDSVLLQLRIQPVTWYLLGFLLASLPSLYFVTDYPRFYVTMIGTLLAFGACWFVAHFARDVYRLLTQLVFVLAGVGVFGLYQLIGDFLGLPPTLTLLGPGYTKVVFGVARIHATAIEPLYFAGMLFLPLVFCSWHLLSGSRLRLDYLPARIAARVPRMTIAWLSYFALLVALTYSKSALALLSFFGVGSIVLTLRHRSGRFVWRVFWPLTASVIAGAWAVSLYLPQVSIIATNLYNNFAATLVGESASSTERGYFTSTAQDLLTRQPLLGIGSGQYGVQARSYLDFLPSAPGQYFIVNNVYLEVWLEFGLLALCVFLALFVVSLWRGYRQVFAYRFDTTPSPVIVLTLTLTLYLFQWLTFSPIFIMPIFILLGLLHRALQENADTL